MTTHTPIVAIWLKGFPRLVGRHVVALLTEGDERNSSPAELASFSAVKVVLYEIKMSKYIPIKLMAFLQEGKI